MKLVLKEICVLFLKGICVLLICVLLYIITLVGCKLIGSDWDKKFAIGTYGCMNEENAYFIANDGIYDKKILLPSVEYGGRAFSGKYLPFSDEIGRAHV